MLLIGQPHTFRMAAANDLLGRLTPQGQEHILQTRQSRLQALDDLFGQLLRLGQVVEVGEAVVLQPEEVEAGFVAGGQLGVGELPPAAGRIFLRVPCFDAFVAVLGL